MEILRVNNYEELKKTIGKATECTEAIEIQLEPYGDFEAGQHTLQISCPVVIDGCGATIHSERSIVFLITSSDVEVKNCYIDNAQTGIAIDPSGRKIENITIRGNRFSNYHSFSIYTGSTRSNGVLRHCVIEGNEFVGKDFIEEESMAEFTCAISVNAANAKDGTPVDNCVIEDLTIRKNNSHGGSRLAIHICTGACNFMDAPKIGLRHNSVIRDVRILDNHFDGAWDATVNFSGGIIGEEDSSIENVEIAYNRICHGLWGIGVVGNEPLFGEVSHIYMRKFDIHHNVLIKQDVDVGEPVCAIGIICGRIDYYGGVKVHDSCNEGYRIHDNTITNADNGIALWGASALLDGNDSELENCHNKNFEIFGNRIYATDTPFRFAAASLEGRLFDWNIGYPRRNKAWAELHGSNDITTCRCHNNSIDGVFCHDNYVKGYRYKYKIIGAEARGHGNVRGNAIKNIKIGNNRFEDGEGHVLVADCVLADWAQDGGENSCGIMAEGKLNL